MVEGAEVSTQGQSPEGEGIPPATPSAPRPARRWWKGWLIAAALIAAYVGLAVAATWPMVTEPDVVVLGDGELGGWLWRYWLMKLEIRALLQELPHDPLAAFFWIISLGRFPETGNVLDLILLSLPLEWLFGDPTYYNVKCVVLMVTDCLAGYAFFHYLSRNRLVALIAGATFGFNSFVFYEIFSSGLRQALMCFIPLYALALERTLHQRRFRSAALAGLLLALAAIFYWFNGLFLALYTALRVAWHLWERRRDPGLGRLVALLVVLGLVTTPIAGLFAWPYVGEMYKDPGAASLPEVQWFTSYPSLQEILNAPVVPMTPEENLLASLARAVPSSWSLDWIFNPLHQRAVPLVMGLLALVVGLARWRRTGFWLVTFLFFFLMTGGPFLRMWDAPGDLNFVILDGGYSIRMPYTWAFKYVPLMSRMFAPYRMGCMVMLALGALLALNLGAIMKALGSRWRQGVVGILFLALYFGQLFGDAWIIAASGREGFGKDRGLPIYSSEIRIHPFYGELAQEEGNIGLIHLPLRYQQDLLTYLQTVHGKKVLLQTGWANPGALPPVLRTMKEPKGEITPRLQYILSTDRVQSNTFVQALSAMNSPPHSFQPYRAEDVGELYANGYRYILLHERGCYLVRPDAGTALYDAIRSKLERRFGEPIVEVKEFTADDQIGNRTGHIVAGVELGWISSEPPLIPSRRPLAYHLAVFRVDAHVEGLGLPDATSNQP